MISRLSAHAVRFHVIFHITATSQQRHSNVGDTVSAETPQESTVHRNINYENNYGWLTDLKMWANYNDSSVEYVFLKCNLQSFGNYIKKLLKITSINCVPNMLMMSLSDLIRKTRD